MITGATMVVLGCVGLYLALMLMPVKRQPNRVAHYRAEYDKAMAKGSAFMAAKQMDSAWVYGGRLDALTDAVKYEESLRK